MKKRVTLPLFACTFFLSSPSWAEFVKDSSASLNLRNFYFDNDTRNAKGRTTEWGQGAVLNYRSGFTSGVIGVGLDAMGMVGLRLDGGKGRHTGSSMIPDESDGSARSEWGRSGATAKLHVSKTVLRYGDTLQPILPILKTNDGRLLPQTYSGGMVTSDEFEDLTLVAGQLEHMVGRGSTNESGFAVGGPSGQLMPQSNKFRFAGGDWKAAPNLLLQYYYANLEDYYGQHYAGLVHTLPLGSDRSLSTDLRFFHTESDGANASVQGRKEGYRVGGYTHGSTGEIDNNTWSAALTYKQDSHSIMFGHQRVSDNSNFVQPNQGGTGEGAGGTSNYILTDRLVTNFTRAGEQSTFAQYDYNFKSLGLPGLSTGVSYVKGTNIKNTRNEAQSEWERDITMDYLVQTGLLKGLKVSWRNGTLRGNATTDQDQKRLIVGYSIPLL